MKTIDKLTEQEIIALTDQEITQMIKFKMAEKGIRIEPIPVKPATHIIPQKDKVVYKCALFGPSIVCEDVTEMESLILLVKELKTACSINSDYSSKNDPNHILPEIKASSYSSKNWDEIESQKVYSSELFAKVKSAIEQNEKIEESYKKRMDEYTASQDGVVDIQNEIWDRVREVKDKYATLDLHVYRFINEYMPLADNNEKVAMNFLKKAYSITSECEAYILRKSKSK